MVSKVAKVTFRTVCCRLYSCKSVLFFWEFNCLHISGLIFLQDMPGQFAGRLYFSIMIFSLSGFNFLPQRFVAISASFCSMFGPLASSSSDKDFAKSSKIFVWPSGLFSRALRSEHPLFVSSAKSAASSALSPA